MTAEVQIALRARTQRLRSLAAVCWLAVVCCMLFVLTMPTLAQAGKRLVLKDGSWQEVLDYKVEGDRTRYLSTLRREWEEVPSELVDWAATERWNAQPMRAPPDEEEGAPAGAIDAGGFAVVPGLQLPAAGGVFLLDTFSGEPSLVELIQTPGALNHRAAGIFHSSVGPRAPVKQRLTIRGASARTRAHIPLPQIFIKFAEPLPAQPLAPQERFRIVKLEPDKESRILASIHNTFMGKQGETEEFVPARTESFGEGWLRVVPLQELKPGEYALVEMLDQDRFNSYVWDFAFDPHAPGNVNTHKPYSEATVDERDTFTPELKRREK